MSWQDTPLSSLADVRSGGGAPQKADAFSDSGHPFVRAGSLVKLLSGTPENALEKISPEVARSHGLKLFPSGTVLFAKSGMSATKGHIYALRETAYVVNHLAALVPHKPTDSAFLSHALQQFSPTSLIKDPAYPSIRLGDIENMNIFVPRDSSMRARIAAILDQADTLRRKRRESVERITTIRDAIFSEMFGDLVSNSLNWANGRTLDDFADIASGITKGRKLKGQATREIPYLAVSNVQDRRLKLQLVKTIEATEEEIKRWRLVKNDLILTEGGDPDKLGRGTLWREELPECIHQNHIFRVRIKSTDIHPLFASWIIASPRGKKYFLMSAKQTTGIASINMTQLKSFPMLVPPVKLQNEFAERMTVIEETTNAAIRHAGQLDSLFASLQHRAFRGEL